jgi:hypothetical protein
MRSCLTSVIYVAFETLYLLFRILIYHEVSNVDKI